MTNAGTTKPETGRAAQIAVLRKTRHIPVLIVGGGINGMGTFRDLSLQGIGCLLAERGDFCSGASRAPSRMIHGGLKYLETGEFRLVRESAAERNRLLANAPHYVAPLELVIPIHSWFGGTWAALRKFLRLPAKLNERGALVIKFGLWLYDVYGAANRATPRHRMIARQDILREIPDLDPSVRLAASYYDAWIVSPERLVVELGLDGMAALPSNMAMNHLRFSRIDGNEVELQDTLGGETFRLTCDVLVNASGAWIDGVNAAAVGTAPRMIGGTRGSHLMLDLPALAKTLHGRMIYFEAEGGRICILSNFMGHVLLGSTDVPVADPEAVVCDDAEVDYLFAAFRRIFPQIPVSRDDIFFSYAGIRPLPASDASDPGAISRDHSMPELPAEGARRFPIVSLVGGKWTTFRAFAAEAADHVLKRLGRTRRISTEDLPIGGGAGLSQAAAPAERLAAEICRGQGLSRDRAHQLVRRYGSRATFVAGSLGRAEQQLTALPEFSHEEIAHVCQTEWVETAEDFLFGRTSIFLERPIDLVALDEVVTVIGDLRGWDNSRRRAELAALVGRYRRLHRIVPGATQTERPQFTLASAAGSAA